jgi:hypothetical protein
VYLPLIIEPGVIIVTNASDIVNGNTSSISALIANPGVDGISLREAITASNTASGAKSIKFSPTLIGSTIQIGSDGDVPLPSLTAGGLTIDGDINRDGSPDITLDFSLGNLNTSLANGFNIRSSFNTIEGLRFVDLAGGSVDFSCFDSDCKPDVITGNQILNNIILSDRGGGIEIGVLGYLSQAEAPHLNNKVWQDITISGNTFVISGQTAIGIRPGVGGASNNHVIGMTVSSNYIYGGSVGIDVIAADVASDYFSVPGPIIYSDNNTIENLTITNNRIEGQSHYGISLLTANYGNRLNKVLTTKIMNNTIQGTGDWTVGILVVTASESGSERSTSNNVMEDIEISQNIVSGFANGIYVGVADKPYIHPAAGFENNRLAKLLIADNTIQNYSSTGIRAWGGWSLAGTVGSLDGQLDQLSILRNSITTTVPQGSPTGIELIGGISSEGPVLRNFIQDITISNNTINGNHIAISLIGGRGKKAQNNIVRVAEISSNLLAGNGKMISIVDNIEGATGNRVYLP